MKRILILVLLSISSLAFSQTVKLSQLEYASKAGLTIMSKSGSTPGTYVAYWTKSPSVDTTSLSARINGKVDYSDTSSLFATRTFALRQKSVLTAGTGISISGTSPNYTITNSSPSSGGTVTSVATGYGLSGGTISTTGTLKADTSSSNGVASKYYVLSHSGGSMSTMPLNSITAATAASTINNAAYATEWQWNSLASGNGFSLTSNSTAAASNTQTLFNIGLSGINGTTTQTTYGGQISNTHTGAFSTNVALKLNASGANNNYALLATGNVGLGTATPLLPLHVVVTSATGNPSYITGADVALFEGGKYSLLQLQGNGANDNTYGISFSTKTTRNHGGIYYDLGTGGPLNGNGIYCIVNAATKMTIGPNGVYAGGGVLPTSTLQSGGSFGTATVSKSANYTLTSSDQKVIFTATATATLPTAVGCSGREYFIINTSAASTITIATTLSQTINGSVPSTYNLTTQYSKLCVFSDGSNWLIKHQ